MRTVETIPCEATSLPIADAGPALVVPTAIIAMTSASEATSFCRCAPSIVLNVAAFLQCRVVHPLGLLATDLPAGSEPSVAIAMCLYIAFPNRNPVE
jgi:hypothetical protein